MQDDKRQELYTISVMKDDNDSILFVERRTAEGYNLFEAAFLSALFLSLSNEFHRNLVDYQGEEKTYLIEEFYKLEVADLRAEMDRQIRVAVAPKNSDSVLKALDIVRDENKDLDGYN